MTKRTGIIAGAASLALVFLGGVFLGSLGQDRATTDTTTVGPSTTRPRAFTTTNSPATTTTSTATSTTTAGGVTLPVGWASAEVVEVIDGDTIDVRLEGGSVERLRLIGINSPERGECYAEEATAGLSSLVLGQTVRLEADTSDRDRYGRLLRYVWTADGRFVNEVTVAEGWALAREYPPDVARSDRLGEAQDRARQSGIGLWASDVCGNGAPADIQIFHIEYDAPGDDNFNLNGEWADITNLDATTVDLTGWTLKDESASHRYLFPNGFTLEPGSTVRVFTGCGEDSADELHWCNTGSAVWNNGGDTGFLLDPAGNVVHSYAYG